MRHSFLMTFTACGMRRYYNGCVINTSLNTKIFITFSALISVSTYLIANNTKIRLEVLIAALVNIVECGANSFTGILILLLVTFVTGKYGQVIKQLSMLILFRPLLRTGAAIARRFCLIVFSHDSLLTDLHYVMLLNVNHIGAFPLDIQKL